MLNLDMRGPADDGTPIAANGSTGAPPPDDDEEESEADEEDDERDVAADADALGDLHADPEEDDDADLDDDEDAWEQVQQMDQPYLSGIPRDILRIDRIDLAGDGGATLSNLHLTPGGGHHARSHHHHGSREPRPVLLAGQGQSVRDIQRHPMLIDRGSREAAAHEQDSTRQRQLARGPYAHLLSQIGEQLGDNAFSLFESVLGSVNAMQAQMAGAQYSLLTQDGQVAANLRLDAPQRAGNGADRNATRQRAELRINNNFEGLATQLGGGGQQTGSGSTPTALSPTSTFLRWDQEGRTFQGAMAHAERTGSLVVHLINALLPRALKEAEELQKQEKEAKAKREAEEKERKEKAEEEERKRKQEKEEAERQERERREEEQQQQRQQEQSAPSQPSNTVEDTATAMQGVSVSDQPDSLAEVMALARSIGTQPGPGSTDTSMQVDNEEQPRAGSSQSAAPAQAQEPQQQQQQEQQPERVTVTIHGATVDITNTGIDPTFLEALPDEMREEVVSQHLRENAAAAAAAARPGAQGSGQEAQEDQQGETSISREFLDALPPDIRAEVIQQEAAEHGRQNLIRSRGRGAADAASGGHDAEEDGLADVADMDPASFLASLLDGDPELRREVLMQQIQEGGQGFMDTLPPGVLDEAQGLTSRRLDSDLLMQTNLASRFIDCSFFP